MKSNALIAAVALLLVTACSGRSDDTATPRPRAYHRIEIPLPAYDTTFLSTGHRIVANAQALVMEKRKDGPSTWIDIVYPSMGRATLYCSITPVTEATVDAVVDNRLERMALNSGGYQSLLSEFTTPSGYECRVLVTGAGTATPVQFIAVSPRDVVSGTLMVNVADGFRPDSIAPVVDAVSRDVEILLKSL